MSSNGTATVDQTMAISGTEDRGIGTRVVGPRVAPAAPTPTSPTAPRAPAKPGRTKKIVGLSVLGVAIIAGGIAGAMLYEHSLRFVGTDDAYVDGHIERVAPQVTGRVLRVLVQDNEEVKAGQVVVELDPAEYAAMVDQAKGEIASAASAVQQATAQAKAAQATLASAQADAMVAQAGLEQARAQVTLAQANAANAATQRDRYIDIQKNSPNAVAEQQIDDARTAAETTAAQLASAQSNVALAQAKITQSRAGIEQANAALAQADAVMAAARAQQLTAQARLERAQIDLDRTKVVAQTSGRVTRRTVDAGNIVQPGQGLMAIVSDDVWVTANLKETQLAHVKPGQVVDVSIDAVPGHVFRGRVDSIMAGTGAAFSLLPAENATGNFVKVVQRVPVKIVFDASDPRTKTLSIGMSVEPEIHIAGERNDSQTQTASAD
ncbi:MAG: biotin/lipoyl-binding protein [Tepidisphaera sp.]|nr:biotin/lipoyl-binding protein [Tepidisphaera sp.]